MENLTKESILKAIQIIDANPDLIKGRESFQYDLVYNGKKYPPILVLSEANKLLGGDELMLKDFGNSAKKAFLYLSEFEIVNKDKVNNMKEDFKKFLQKTNRDGSNKASSYYQAINLLNKILIRKSGKMMDGFSEIWQIDSIDTIEELYDYVRVEQHNLISGIFINEKPESYWKKGFYSAALKSYKEFLEERFQTSIVKKNDEVNEPDGEIKDKFNASFFKESVINSGLLFSPKLTTRLISSLLTKPFVILTGLSGSGKTKLAQAFSKWICEDENQYCVVPVGADWTNREPLLGYPNALKPDEYVKPDNGVLDLIIRANKNSSLPYFLILDEMNLSHVERYFADFLSVMESDEEIPLFAEGTVNNGVPAKLNLPDNLFIIGTVNIDETTYMFSPKVLDRANTIEFRVNENEIEHFLNNKTNLNLDELTGQGSSMAIDFLELSRKKIFDGNNKKETTETLLIFFNQLKKAGAEFGYRSANEIIRLINQLNVVDSDLSADEKLDISIMQKLLPKLHGSRRKLCPVLTTLGGFCVTDKISNIEKEIFEKDDFDFYNMEKVKYPLSLEKITRMYKGAIDNGFASYAEA